MCISRTQNDIFTAYKFADAIATVHNISVARQVHSIRASSRARWSGAVHTTASHIVQTQNFPVSGRALVTRNTSNLPRSNINSPHHRQITILINVRLYARLNLRSRHSFYFFYYPSVFARAFIHLTNLPSIYLHIFHSFPRSFVSKLRSFAILIACADKLG